MSIYSFLVLIHVVAAVVGLGASFAMPVVMKSPATAGQAKYSLNLNSKIETFAKVGSIILLITGLVLGILNTALFTQAWYIASIAIYIGVQFIVAGIMPKKIKSMAEIMENHKGDDIPDPYTKLNQELRPYNAIIHTAAVVLIVLMSLKPF
ncbi:DUF2269 family protein [Bacillus sp. ISL-47]|uniref:DUF2269 family protein n=1 Tax=Bacillus sp. ISL-47 TaxID=2819130 RepID=UPI001BE9AACC|nr:DUF2269 family protein [Bacillus sp. ISL-47]MBT2688406.1 DUF2269 family protein [Bacillus sp. ISL-47]MBT2707278.1 DUF2269 family protein [Pseudomonas sp. ISL-84]